MNDKTSPQGLRLRRLETLQREGAKLSDYSRGSLAALKRSPDPEISARAAIVEQVDDRRRRRAAARKVAETDADDVMGADR